MNTKLNTLAIFTIGLSLMLSSIGNVGATVTLDEAKSICEKQRRLAAEKEQFLNVVAFSDALHILDGSSTELTKDSRGLIAIARNNAVKESSKAELTKSQRESVGKVADTMEMVLTKAGVPTEEPAPSANSDAPQGLGVYSSSGKGVDRCNYMLKRGPRSKHVCGRSKKEHVHSGGYDLCPDELCSRCGRSPQVHYWESDNGFLCHLHHEEVVAMVRQTNMPPVIVVSGASAPTYIPQAVAPRQSEPVFKKSPGRPAGDPDRPPVTSATSISSIDPMEPPAAKQSAPPALKQSTQKKGQSLRLSK